MFRPYL